ncbi:MAG: sigma-70 family RNA polymerase sigma factor [Verrucomicrobiae bacterium]|nr:sigma-70 family RNA polymerase sigma factor [Verrucomicrobiae bacterium]
MSPAPMDDPDDRDMRRLMAGHDDALDALMDRHAQRLFHYLFRCLQDEGDAADLSQECFVRVYRHRTRFTPGHRFSVWLYAIATNLLKDRYRWRSRHPSTCLSADTEGPNSALIDVLPDTDPSPDQAAQARERSNVIRSAIAALPEALRQPLILAEYESLSHEEIGTVLGCSTKAVETRLYRARQTLRTRLARLLGAD